MLHLLVSALFGLFISAFALSMPSISSITQTQPKSSASFILPTINATSLQTKAWPSTPFTYPVSRGLSLRINHLGDLADQSKTDKVQQSLNDLQYWIEEHYPPGINFEGLLVRQGNVGVWFRSVPPLLAITAEAAILVLIGASILMSGYGPRDIAEADIIAGGGLAMGFVLDIY